MERESVHTLPHALHHHFSPVVIIVAGTGSNLVECVAAERTCIFGIAAIEVSVVFGAHLSAATPTLVTDTDIMYVPRLVAPVLAAEVRHRRIIVGGHILHPFRRFARCAAAYVHTHVGFAAE